MKYNLAILAIYAGFILAVAGFIYVVNAVS